MTGEDPGEYLRKEILFRRRITEEKHPMHIKIHRKPQGNHNHRTWHVNQNRIQILHYLLNTGLETHDLIEIPSCDLAFPELKGLLVMGCRDLGMGPLTLFAVAADPHHQSDRLIYSPGKITGGKRLTNMMKIQGIHNHLAGQTPGQILRYLLKAGVEVHGLTEIQIHDLATPKPKDLRVKAC